MARLQRRTIQKKKNHDGLVTHLEPDFLECEVKWGLGSITLGMGKKREVRASPLLEDRERSVKEHGNNFILISERKESICHSQHPLSIKS